MVAVAPVRPVRRTVLVNSFNDDAHPLHALSHHLHSPEPSRSHGATHSSKDERSRHMCTPEKIRPYSNNERATDMLQRHGGSNQSTLLSFGQHPRVNTYVQYKCPSIFHDISCIQTS